MWLQSWIHVFIVPLSVTVTFREQLHLTIRFYSGTSSKNTVIVLTINVINLRARFPMLMFLINLKGLLPVKLWHLNGSCNALGFFPKLLWNASIKSRKIPFFSSKWLIISTYNCVKFRKWWIFLLILIQEWICSLNANGPCYFQYVNSYKIY